ncbi:MAG TPA: ATP-dependent DNA helicase RecQ, partial [Allocoleopsis sp.]
MSKPRRSKPNLKQIAQQKFGYTDLRPGQTEAIQAILDGHDVLTIMPTGSGKSAIYQMAGFLLPGATVVVSPLIALQRDQVNSIAEQNFGDAAMVNSTLSTAEKAETFEQLEDGALEFLFLAPEQFNTPETLTRLQEAQPSLFVVDEAHCISAWGHNFRPDYLRLGQVIEALGHPRVLALTATAAPPVRSEIVERLGMLNAMTLVQGFDRPNLWLGVERSTEEDEKQPQLLQTISHAEKPGIVYVATRKRSEELAASLQEQGIRSHHYHAGMKAADRQQVEIDFMQDQIEVLVATTAFGMGVDKPNVRFVFHADISDSLDSYYQEIGRAGRDGDPAHAILFYNPDDLKLRRFFASGGQVDEEDTRQVAAVLQQQETAISPKELQEQVDLSKSKLRSAVNYLVEVGAVETSPTGEISAVEELDLDEVAEATLQKQDQRQHIERSRLEMMRNYAEVRGCRREYLLNYFGETFTAPCGYCDNCKAGIQAESTTHQPFAIDSQVIHTAWGKGTVMRYEGDKIV